jgi:hypothetical protein
MGGDRCCRQTLRETFGTGGTSNSSCRVVATSGSRGTKATNGSATCGLVTGSGASATFILAAMLMKCAAFDCGRYALSFAKVERTGTARISKRTTIRVDANRLPLLNDDGLVERRDIKTAILRFAALAPLSHCPVSAQYPTSGPGRTRNPTAGPSRYQKSTCLGERVYVGCCTNSTCYATSRRMHEGAN